MSNFLDLETQDESSSDPQKLRELLTRVPVSTPPTRLHPDISDRLAEQHGFSSRERASVNPGFVGGRRQPRGVVAEDTRQLSIRMPVSLYNEFLSFANDNKMTYNEAIRTLLNKR